MRASGAEVEALLVGATRAGVARRHHADLRRAVAVADGDVGQELGAARPCDSVAGGRAAGADAPPAPRGRSGVRRSSSISGRAYASPTIVIMLTRSRAAVSRMVARVEAARVVVEHDGRAHVGGRGTPSTARRRASAATWGTRRRRRSRRAPRSALCVDGRRRRPCAATNRSAWRHSTAFGCPVVPPVHTM